LPLDLLRPGPLMWIHERRQGNGTGKYLSIMADFIVFPFFGKPVMEYSDRVLKCVDCGAEFVFTAGEQLFFHDKQFANDPKHCKQCKAKRAKSGSRARPETRTNCSECGAATTVPFKPTQGRPVLCRSCFQKQKGNTNPVAEAKPVSEPTPVPN
jgi:CxxC-x17-CxxC domain-containing protein